MTDCNLILGIETSCDETAAAVVADGAVLLSNIVSSQTDVHAHFGGVVPEVASRKHTELVTLCVELALHDAAVTADRLAAIAVTNGPGLIGSLLVGVSAAKAYSWAWEKPLIGINHLEAHVCANFLIPPDQSAAAAPAAALPAVCLVVSGGHSEILLVRELGDYELLGATRDDAAGEAFDKVARLLDLGYPGGPALDRAAREGDPHALEFPIARLEGSLDFSFSGPKTAVARLLEGEPGRYPAPDVAAAFERSVVTVLVENTLRAAQETQAHAVLIAGGVAANTALRDLARARCAAAGLVLHIPPIDLCTDNAAMVAAAGHFALARRGPDDLALDTFSVLPLADDPSAS